MKSNSPHFSVLTKEIVEAFHDQKIKVFLDGTLGAGGHAALILSDHPEIEIYIGIDQDPKALAIAKERLAPWEHKVRYFHGNFSEFEKFIKELNLKEINGILVDLGVSSMQLDEPSRGFSFSKEGPLDMRMNPNNPLTAEIVVNEYSEQELGRIFRELGEEKKWRIAAKAIVDGRKKQRITTTAGLANVLKPVLSYNPKKGINPLTLIFQGLRIFVNKELDVLEQLMNKFIQWLSPQGRLAVISFHSLEDRITKNHMRFEASDKWDTVGLGGIFRDKPQTARLITKKPIVPSIEEIDMNPRSRSAKLRVLEKL